MASTSAARASAAAPPCSRVRPSSPTRSRLPLPGSGLRSCSAQPDEGEDGNEDGHATCGPPEPVAIVGHELADVGQEDGVELLGGAEGFVVLRQPVCAAGQQHQPDETQARPGCVLGVCIGVFEPLTLPPGDLDTDLGWIDEAEHGDLTGDRFGHLVPESGDVPAVGPCLDPNRVPFHLHIGSHDAVSGLGRSLQRAFQGRPAHRRADVRMVRRGVESDGPVPGQCEKEENGAGGAEPPARVGDDRVAPVVVEKPAIPVLPWDEPVSVARSGEGDLHGRHDASGSQSDGEDERQNGIGHAHRIGP